jgi:hypothetical protein
MQGKPDSLIAYNTLNQKISAKASVRYVAHVKCYVPQVPSQSRTTRLNDSTIVPKNWICAPSATKPAPTQRHCSFEPKNLFPTRQLKVKRWVTTVKLFLRKPLTPNCGRWVMEAESLLPC